MSSPKTDDRSDLAPDYEGDALKREIRGVIEDMHDEGKSFVKATHVVKRLDDPPEPKAAMKVGKRLAVLADDGVVDVWSPGDSGAVWRITL